jgi:hypothetical protein
MHMGVDDGDGGFLGFSACNAGANRGRSSGLDEISPIHFGFLPYSIASFFGLALIFFGLARWEL